MRFWSAAGALTCALVVLLLAGAGCGKPRNSGRDRAAVPPAEAPPAAGMATEGGASPESGVPPESGSPEPGAESGRGGPVDRGSAPEGGSRADRGPRPDGPMGNPRAHRTGMPPVGMTDAQGPLDGRPVPLKKTGSNSAEELSRDLARLSTPAQRTVYEEAFRAAFCARVAQRDYPKALDLARTLIKEKPDFAPAYRVLGYASFNVSEASDALNAYLKAVEIDPNYGRAHYALAFMLAMGDRAKGREHFEKAMKLGIQDEQNLGSQFYP